MNSWACSFLTDIPQATFHHIMLNIILQIFSIFTIILSIPNQYSVVGYHLSSLFYQLKDFELKTWWGIFKGSLESTSKLLFLSSIVWTIIPSSCLSDGDERSRKVKGRNLFCLKILGNAWKAVIGFVGKTFGGDGKVIGSLSRKFLKKNILQFCWMHTITVRRSWPRWSVNSAITGSGLNNCSLANKPH